MAQDLGKGAHGAQDDSWPNDFVQDDAPTPTEEHYDDWQAEADALVEQITSSSKRTEPPLSLGSDPAPRFDADDIGYERFAPQAGAAAQQPVDEPARLGAEAKPLHFAPEPDPVMDAGAHAAADAGTHAAPVVLPNVSGEFPAAQGSITSDPRIASLPRVDTSEPPLPNAGLPAISLVHVSKIYPATPDRPALDDITLDIYTGEFVFLVGHSGSGKSTFIRLLNREIVATKGQIFVGGENLSSMRSWRIPYLRRNVGCVFQDFKLLPNKTTFENVAFALEVIGKPRAVIRTQVPEVLRLVGLQEKMDKKPDQLSGGEQQRVSIARAMVNRPPYLICDEPTGNLDPQTSLGIMRLLERINRTGTTVVVATHDREMVDSMRRRVIALENGHLVRDQDRGVYGFDV